MGGGLSAPRWGRAPLFAYRGLRLPPLSWGRVTPGLAGVRRRGPCASGVWCASARAHARGVLPLLPWRCVSRGAWGAPARPAPPCAARAAAVSRPLLPFRARRWRVARGRGSGPPGFGRRFPGAWLRDGPNGWRLETGSRGGGPVGLDPRAVRCGAGPGSWGGSLRVLRPAGAAGVAGPPSCWWRWDPVHVYPVAWFASPLARPSPSPCPPPRARSLVLASCVCPLPAASGPPPVLCCFFFSPSVSARTTERASAPSPLPPPSPCRARDQASPLVGCPPPPWAAMALGGPGPGRSAVGPARVSEGMGGRREKGAPAARVGGSAGAGRGWWVAARAGERSRGRSRGCCGWQGRRALCEGLPQGSPRGRAGSASGGATGPPLCWRPRAVGPRAHPGGDLAPPPQGAWLETRGAPLPLARGPVPRRSSPAPRCPCRQASVSWPPPFGYQTRWRALVCGRFPGPLRPPLRVRRHRPARRRCCVQTGGIVRPLPPPCPPHPPLWRARAWAWGGSRLVRRWLPRDRAPAPRWRGARVSARPPPRVSVCAGLLCQPRRDLSGAPSLARAPPPGCWGSARVGGGDVCVSSPASPRRRRCWPGPAGAGSVSPSRSLAAGWDGARLEWARRARLLLRLSLPAGSRAPGGRGAAAATAASPPPPPGRVAAPCSVRPVHRETCAAPRCALSLAHRAPTWLILPVAYACLKD